MSQYYAYHAEHAPEGKVFDDSSVSRESLASDGWCDTHTKFGKKGVLAFDECPDTKRDIPGKQVYDENWLAQQRKELAQQHEELEARKKALDEFDKEHREIIDALEKKIENLLSGATNTGLASAYREQKDEAHQNEALYQKMFVRCVIFWMPLSLLLSCFTFFVAELDSASDWAKNIFIASSIMTPLAILTAFYSKRRSEQHRLKQEYAHKEALAKSYDSFKKQVEALAGATADKGKKDELLSYLMETMIEAIGFNPAKTLDKKHGDDTPSKNPVNRIMEKEE